MLKLLKDETCELYLSKPWEFHIRCKTPLFVDRFICIGLECSVIQF